MEIEAGQFAKSAQGSSACASTARESKFRELLTSFSKERFLDHDATNADLLIELVRSGLLSTYSNEAIGETNLLRQPISVVARDAKIPTNSIPAEILMASLGQNTFGALKAADPFTAKNIIPLPNLSALATHLAASTLMANGVTGEDAGVMLVAGNCMCGCDIKVSRLPQLTFRRTFYFRWDWNESIRR